MVDGSALGVLVLEERHANLLEKLCVQRGEDRPKERAIVLQGEHTINDTRRTCQSTPTTK